MKALVLSLILAFVVTAPCLSQTPPSWINEPMTLIKTERNDDSLIIVSTTYVTKTVFKNCKVTEEAGSNTLSKSAEKLFKKQIGDNNEWIYSHCTIQAIDSFNEAVNRSDKTIYTKVEAKIYFKKAR